MVIFDYVPYFNTILPIFGLSLALGLAKVIKRPSYLVFVPSLPVRQLSSSFRVDSRLLVVNPPGDDGKVPGAEEGARTLYAVWEGTRFVPAGNRE